MKKILSLAAVFVIIFSFSSKAVLAGSLTASLTSIDDPCKNTSVATMSVDSISASTNPCGGTNPVISPIQPKPGWPVALSSNPLNTSVAAANLNTDSSLEVAISLKDSSGSNSGVYTLKSDGTSMRYFKTTNKVESSLAIADVNLDGVPDIISVDYFGKIDVWDSQTGSELPGWPVSMPIGAFVSASPVVANLNDDPYPEIMIASWNKKIYAFNHDGTELIVHADQTHKGEFAVISNSFYASPSVGDVDGDGKPEIVAVDNANNLYIWRRDGSGFLNSTGLAFTSGRDPIENKAASTLSPVAPQSSPVIADIDGDGKAEVILGNYVPGTFSVNVFSVNSANSAAVPIPGWPKTFINQLSSSLASVAVADLDKTVDGLEIVAATQDGKVYAWHKDGTVLFGPLSVGSAIDASPVIGDVDGDGNLDVVVAAHDGKIYAWHSDGSAVTDWPIVASTSAIEYSTPMLTDLDGDGITDLIVGCDDGKVYAWTLGKPYNGKNMPWPRFRKDLANTASLVRPALFADTFDNTTLDRNKWSATNWPSLFLTGDGRVAFSGDGQQYHAAGINSVKNFDKNKNLTFLYEGFSFDQTGTGLNLILGGGGFRDANGRMIVLTIGNQFNLWTAVGYPAVTTLVNMDSRYLPAYTPGTKYSMLIRFYGDPSVTNKRLEVYIYQTASGFNSVGGPVYTWNDVSWNPNIGASIYPGFGNSYIDGMYVLGPEGAVLDQNTPKVTSIVDVATGLPVANVSFIPGQSIQLKASGTFTAGSQEPSPCSNTVYSGTGFSWAQHQEPPNAQYPYYPYWNGSFNWIAPATPGTYQFTATMWTCSGLRDLYTFPVTVRSNTLVTGGGKTLGGKLIAPAGVSQ